jgi:hypothetical protein
MAIVALSGPLAPPLRIAQGTTADHRFAQATSRQASLRPALAFGFSDRSGVVLTTANGARRFSRLASYSAACRIRCFTPTGRYKWRYRCGIQILCLLLQRRLSKLPSARTCNRIIRARVGYFTPMLQKGKHPKASLQAIHAWRHIKFAMLRAPNE